ncbi:exported protein (PHISTa) [Plasmodium gaboni]|uniref:Exported protein (PHISTa) n=1 Tax=Plasmodium gaboni TaxID=647221 RepID=A0A151L344_9APIC|nr:exported protein (PHISTa) [Plasmodium gaboni]KYN93388.1 exported protein (PHISTa) [Plasmodium gaboni]
MKNIINKKFDSISAYIYLNKNGILFYRSFSFFLLILYFIGIFYVSLKYSYQNESEEKKQYYFIYSRNLFELKKVSFESFRNKIGKCKLWNKKDDVNKKKNNEENIEDFKKQNITKNEAYCSNEIDTSNKKEGDFIKVKNNNYISKQLSKEELHDLLYTFVEVPERQILLFLWNQILGLYDEKLNDLLKDIFNFIPNRVYRNEKNREGRSFYKLISREMIFDKCVINCREELAIKKVEFTKGYYDLLDNKNPMEDVRKFIFSCIEQYDELMKKFCNKYKKKPFPIKALYNQKEIH